MNPTIETGTYKNKPILTFRDEKRVILSFGLRKAILITENIEEIKKFVQENTQALGEKKPNA